MPDLTKTAPEDTKEQKSREERGEELGAQANAHISAGPSRLPISRPENITPAAPQWANKGADSEEVRPEILVDKGSRYWRWKRDEGQPRLFSWIAS